MTAASPVLPQEYDRPNSAFMLFYERIGGSDELSAITAMQPSAAAPAEAPAAMDAIPAGPLPVPFDTALHCRRSAGSHPIRAAELRWSVFSSSRPEHQLEDVEASDAVTVLSRYHVIFPSNSPELIWFGFSNIYCCDSEILSVSTAISVTG